MAINSQAVSGFKVQGYQVKKTKEGEKVRLVLEANVEDIGAGVRDVGDVLKALLIHQTSQNDIGVSLLMDGE